MYGLRPEVFLTVFIERGLWERYLRHAPVTETRAVRLRISGVLDNFGITEKLYRPRV